MFSPNSGAPEPRSLIPDKTLAFAVVKFQDIKRSQKTNGEYARLEFTIADGPYANRKVYSIVMNPLDDNNVNQQARAEKKTDGAKMGLTALTRMLEACRVFDPAKPETYSRLNGATFPEIIQQLDGQTVAIKVKLVPAKDGYEEKNEVGEFISPNPASGSITAWNQLIGGPATVQQARGSAFGAAPAQPAAAQPKAGAPGWLKSPASNNPY